MTPPPVETADAVVVGAGIVGVACARSLQRAGLRVTLIDAQEPGGGASSGNAGHIAIDHVRPLARPEILASLPRLMLDPASPLTLKPAGLPRLLPWMWRFAWACRPAGVAAGTTALASLLRHAGAAWAAEAAASGVADLFRDHGAMLLFERPASLRAAAAESRILAAHGVAFDDLSAAAAADAMRAAIAVSGGIAGGRWYPQAAHVVDPHRLVRALAARFTGEGGVLLRGTVEGFDIADGLVRHLRTSLGRLAARHVVLATGAEAAPLARALGVRAPLTRERGYHVMTQALPLAFPVSFAERGFVATPMTAGTRLAGTVELGATKPDWRRAELLLTQAQALFGRSELAADSRWSGDRPTLPDYLPMIGPAARARNAVLALGHQHVGLTLAPVTAELVRAMTLGLQPRVDTAPFATGRFGRTPW